MDRHEAWKAMDNFKREFFLKNEIKRVLLKSIKKNTKTTYARRYLATYYLSTLPRVSSGTLTNNRCVVSGRVWSVNKHTQFSRFVFRKKMYQADIPGCKRASW